MTIHEIRIMHDMEEALKTALLWIVTPESSTQDGLTASKVAQQITDVLILAEELPS
jgi:hypothetical protein